MAIRDPLTEHLPDAPAGAIRIAFWRHLTEVSDSAEMLALHRERAEIVHELAATTGVDVKDWGNVDSPHPSEVVEIVVGAFAGAIATKIVDYLVDYIRERRTKSDRTLLAVSMRDASGKELVWHFAEGVTAQRAAQEISAFAKGKSVERILGN